VTPDYAATILMADFSVLAGQIDRRSMDVALEWAARNREVLQDEWIRLNER
jgi:hypothetical protein